MCKFSWGGKDEANNLHLGKRCWISRPKKMGNIVTKNKALMGKWLWWYTKEKGPLWHKVVKSLYGEEMGGWFTKAPRYTTKRSPWKDIMSCKEEFLSCKEIKVGEDDRSGFWKDKWLGDECFKLRFLDLHRLCIQKTYCIQKVMNGASRQIE